MQPKTVLITGGSRRIGAVMSRFMHQKNYNIIIHYLTSEEEAKTLAVSLNKIRKNSAEIIKADLNDTSQVINLAENAFHIWNQLDGLINNASRFYATPLGFVNEEKWEDLLASNLKAPFFLAQACAKYLEKTHGSIVNITDIHAQRPMKNYSVYSIAKAGLAMLTKTLARELAPTIRVNAVAPGPIIWPEKENSLKETAKQQIIDQIPLKRIGTPEEIAKAVYYLLNDATYSTGQTIDVDGGRNLFI